MSAVSGPLRDIDAGKAWTTYTAQQRDAALIAVIRLGQRKAAEATGIPQQTLSDWCRAKHKARLEELRDQIGDELEAEAVDQARRIILTVQEKQTEALERLDLSEIPARDMPGAIRNLATVQALTVDKTLLPLTNRPSSYTAPAGIDELLKGLKALDPTLVNSNTVDSTAEPDGLPASVSDGCSERAEGSSG